MSLKESFQWVTSSSIPSMRNQ